MKLKQYVLSNELIINVDNKETEITKSTRKIINYCDKNNYELCFKNNSKKLTEKETSKVLIDLFTIMKAVNYKKTKERYNYIYDTICKYLDERIETNYCEFKDNICIKYRNKNSNHENGCCECKGRGKCKYLIDGVCTMKSCMACKLFTCHTLKKMGISQNINDFVLTKYFFTSKQKDILQFSYWTPKEIVMDKLLKNIKVD